MLSRLKKAPGEIAEKLFLRTSLDKATSALFRQRGALILMYHSISPASMEPYISPKNRVAPEIFRRQISHLREHHTLVPLAQIIRHLTDGDRLPENAVAITFDDGYLDNLTVAAPILNEFNVPATIYLATGYIDGELTQWADNIHFLLNKISSNELEKLSSRVLDLFDGKVKTNSATVSGCIHDFMLQSDMKDRNKLFEIIQREFGVRCPDVKTTLSWNDIRRMRKAYPSIDIGAHTKEHMDLSSRNYDAAMVQINGSKIDIERELNISPKDFSFPYGRKNLSSMSQLKLDGWRSATAAGNDLRIGPSSDPFCLARIEVTNDFDHLRFQISKTYTHLRRIGMAK